MNKLLYKLHNFLFLKREHVSDIFSLSILNESIIFSIDVSYLIKDKKTYNENKYEYINPNKCYYSSVSKYIMMKILNGINLLSYNEAEEYLKHFVLTEEMKSTLKGRYGVEIIDFKIILKI